ncbi:hypothetical protein AVEN_111677-1 [Araneus ventricosus]|uniref:Uncharacterized protein n=1 Tax=Araneus ventricosus TaxID=182803 RepID=A0A4Y2LN25_ARAVE|nr:hypothetical protein AVEN_111677-1 [Araneus ventricosus]
MVAVAIETGYRTGNPFRVGKSSFQCVTLAHLGAKQKGKCNCVKIEKTNDQLLFSSRKLTPRIKQNPDFRRIPSIRNGSSLVAIATATNQTTWRADFSSRTDSTVPIRVAILAFLRPNYGNLAFFQSP